jgi:hypothetical protein
MIEIEPIAMRRLLLLPLALALAAAPGCGGGDAAPTAAIPVPARNGPHGGPAYALPENAGLVEVVAEAVKGASDPVVAVYFLAPDGTAPLAALPTDAKIVLGGGESFPLTAKAPARRDKLGAGRLESPPLPVDPDRIAGEVAATVGGRAVALPFALGQ